MASPILAGAVTLLVTVIAVLIAYKANSGLPFVPTYDLRAELPSGAKLVRGNDVRVGGFRVGLVESIEPAVRVVEGKRRAVALAQLRLDKRVEPLAADTGARVRPRSPLGIKFIELKPGSSRRTLVPGDTIELARTSESLEFEDIYETLQPGTRRNVQDVTQGLGDALAGRGQSLNESLAAAPELLLHLTRVMGTLAERDTRLHELIRGLGETGTELAPVASAAAGLFTTGADTLAALNRDPGALQATIERLPPTLATGTRVLRTTRPFVTELSDLARRLRPAAAELPATLPPVASALRVGAPALRRSIPLSERLTNATRELRELVRNPNTLLSLRDLRTALRILRPAIEFIAPYQTVCSYANYFLHPLGEHQSQPGPGGGVQPQLAKIVNLTQPNSVAFTFNSRTWDLMPGQPAHGATFDGQPAGRPQGSPYQPAIDSQGRADCQNGQNGWLNGRLLEPFARKGESGVLPDGTPRGGNAPVAISDYPGLSGGTHKSIELGIDGLEDVP